MKIKKKFTNDEKWIEELANNIISTFWDKKNYEIKNKHNVSAIFLAWAPWAWKTEFLDTIFSDIKKNFIVIDIDKYRNYFKWYDWENSSIYQEASVKVADKILKHCFKNDLNFIFDGTFRNYNKVKQNFEQCEKYNRKSLISLIFQDPRISFYYTFLRKINKKRNVPIDVFVSWFYYSIENSFKTISKFKSVDLMIAHKKYSLLNKEKFHYKIDYKTSNIEDFCYKYWIFYKNWEFKNYKKLKIDIEEYNNILSMKFLWTWTSFLRFRMWLYEKFWKLF
jgi:hypothetical protein